MQLKLYIEKESAVTSLVVLLWWMQVWLCYLVCVQLYSRPYPEYLFECEDL